MGPLTFEEERGPLFLERLMTPSKEYSENTAMEIDEEVKQIVNGTYERVKAILEKEKDKLEKVAKILLEKEVIEGDELRKLIA
jgi:cell division protease FtsH